MLFTSPLPGVRAHVCVCVWRLATVLVLHFHFIAFIFLFSFARDEREGIGDDRPSEL